MKLYKVAVVEVPPKSLVVITPFVAKVQLAPDEAVNTFPPDVTSLNDIALSDEPTTVATVPLKFPAIVPNEPAPVVNDGAVDAVKILFVLLPALPSGFSILTK